MSVNRVNRRPLVLKFVATILLCYPLVMAADAVGAPRSMKWPLWHLATLFVAPIGAVMVFVRPIAWYLGMLSGLYGVGAGAFSLFTLERPFSAIFLILISAASLEYLRRAPIRKLFFEPSLRWWETPPRHARRLQCVLEGVEPVQCETTNISKTGVFLKTSKVLLLGEALKLTIHFPDKTVAVAGKVVRVSKKPRGVGVRFHEPNDAIQSLLWDERAR
jgi:hypothetical protein